MPKVPFRIPKALSRWTPLLSTVGRAFQAQMIANAIKPYADVLHRINASDVQTLIDSDVPLRDVLTPEVYQHEVVRGLVQVDVDTLLAVLNELHPELASVLSTQRGREWWEAQCRDVNQG